MKKFVLSIIMLMGSAYIAPVLADGMFYGVKTGAVDIDVDGVDNPTNGALYMGYEVGLLLADLALEGEIGTTLDEGELDNEEIDVDTVSVFLALRTAGLIYFKAKTGFTRYEFNGLGGDYEDSDTNAVLGIGLGVGLGLLQIEFEITQIEDDALFTSIGVQF